LVPLTVQALDLQGTVFSPFASIYIVLFVLRNFKPWAISIPSTLYPPENTHLSHTANKPFWGV